MPALHNNFNGAVTERTAPVHGDLLLHGLELELMNSFLNYPNWTWHGYCEEETSFQDSRPSSMFRTSVSRFRYFDRPNTAFNIFEWQIARVHISSESIFKPKQWNQQSFIELPTQTNFALLIPWSNSSVKCETHAVLLLKLAKNRPGRFWKYLLHMIPDDFQN